MSLNYKGPAWLSALGSGGTRFQGTAELATTRPGGLLEWSGHFWSSAPGLFDLFGLRALLILPDNDGSPGNRGLVFCAAFEIAEGGAGQMTVLGENAAPYDADWSIGSLLTAVEGSRFLVCERVQ